MTKDQREQFDAELIAPLGDERPASKAATATFSDDEEEAAFAAAYAKFGQE